MRVFTALVPPRAIREQLASYGSLLPDDCPVNWQSEEKIHLTLNFMDDVKPEKIDELREIVRGVSGGVTGLQLILGQVYSSLDFTVSSGYRNNYHGVFLDRKPRTLARGGFSPGKLRLSLQPGQARNRTRPIGIGLKDDSHTLTSLQKRLETALLGRGFSPRANRQFTPHLTLARPKQGFGRSGSIFLNRVLAKITEQETGRAMIIPEIVLVKSVLTRLGSVHEVIDRFQLKNGST